jgi:hypothetical protein
MMPVVAMTAMEMAAAAVVVTATMMAASVVPSTAAMMATAMVSSATVMAAAAMVSAVPPGRGRNGHTEGRDNGCCKRKTPHHRETSPDCF